jgi:glyoxylase-like metal-dependent hydrolase (beta-lactamase superfamily II)
LVAAQFQVGSVIVSVLKDGEWIDQATWGELYAGEWPPEYAAEVGQTVSAPCYCYHIATPTASILVDAGMGEIDLSRATMRIERTDGVMGALATMGLQPTEITHLILTHAHPDHFIGAAVESEMGYIPAYPGAQVYMGAADWYEHPQRLKPESRYARLFTCLQERGLLTLVEGEHHLPDGVSMLPAPGESPGHYVVRVASAGQTAYILGDLIHHPLELEHPAMMTKGRDQAAMLASRQRLIPQMVAEEALILASHVRGSGRLRRGLEGAHQFAYEQRFA